VSRRSRQEPCLACRGRAGHTCPACQGLGAGCLTCPATGEIPCDRCQGTGVVAVRWFRCAAVWVDLLAPEGQRERRCGQLVRVEGGLCADHERQQQLLAAGTERRT
jgi:hypothetical protein